MMLRNTYHRLFCVRGSPQHHFSSLAPSNFEKKFRVLCLEKIPLIDRAKEGKLAGHLSLDRLLTDAKALASALEHKESVSYVHSVLDSFPVEYRVVKDVCEQDINGADLVLTVGGDGTFIYAANKFGEMDTTPIMGVNSAPSTSFGFFSAATKETFENRFRHVFQELTQTKLPPSVAAVSAGEQQQRQQQLAQNDDAPSTCFRDLWRMQILINGEKHLPLVLNDVLIAHRHPAATARYDIHNNGLSQSQGSSGIWVATSAGSTGAIHSAGMPVQPLSEPRLQFCVRELFKLFIPPPFIDRGFCADDFAVTCRMTEVSLFLDGDYQDKTLDFGDILQFRPTTHAMQWVAFDDDPRAKFRDTGDS